MGKKKNKARQLALNAGQPQIPQPLSNPPQPCPNGTALGAVAQSPSASSAAQPKKKHRMTKAEKKQRSTELGIGKEGEAMRREAEAMKREAEDLMRNAESHQASDLNGNALASAPAFFSSTTPSSQGNKRSRQSRRKSRKSSFVGDTLLNVLEQLQGNDSSLPQNFVPASAQNGFAMDGSNDRSMSDQNISTPHGARERAQDMSRHPYNFAPGKMPPPASTLPQTTSGAPHGYNMANAMLDWNNPHAAGLGEGQQTIGYPYQPPTSHSQNPIPMAGVWAQASAPPYGIPPAPAAMGQFAHANPAWQTQGQLGPGGIPPWIPPHQLRTMSVHSRQNWTSRANSIRGSTQHRGFTTDSRNAAPNGQQTIASRPRSPRKSSKAERPNKPGPPRPNPTPQYLAQSLMASHRLTVPQRLLIVMDLNGTLLFRPKSKSSSHFIRRPFSRPFISYLLANHTVMVWSSARPENVNRMCTGLFSPAERKQLKAEWARDMLGLTQKHYNDKVQVFKELRKVWEAANLQQWHPMHNNGERFDQHNTLLIDDSVEKAASEPYNLVEVDDFEAKVDQMSRDVLREVAGYLEDARFQSNVSAWCRAGNRFAYGKGWDREWQEDDAPSHSFDQVLFTQSPSDHVPSAHSGDGLVPASSGQEPEVRLTRSKAKRLVQEETGAPSASSGHQGGGVLDPVPPSIGDAEKKLTRNQKRKLKYRQSKNPT